MLVDTDVLIWNLRGNEKAADRLDSLGDFSISVITYMELIQGMRNRQELRTLRQAFVYWSTLLIHVDGDISARAAFLMEQHALANSMQLADALIAATALEHGMDLLTGNDKHYRVIDGLVIERFRP